MGGLLSFHVIFNASDSAQSERRMYVISVAPWLVERTKLCITTGNFTKDAVREATRWRTAIDLIDGDLPWRSSKS
ncbi:MAG: hypothetical protein R2873_18000 [Caldilineaceae bacterium]